MKNKNYLPIEMGYFYPTEKFKNISEHIALVSPDGLLLAVVGPADDKESEEFGNFIVHAVNSYETLLESCKAMVEFLKKPMNVRSEQNLKDIIMKMNEATAQAEKKKGALK